MGTPDARPESDPVTPVVERELLLRPDNSRCEERCCSVCFFQPVRHARESHRADCGALRRGEGIGGCVDDEYAKALCRSGEDKLPSDARWVRARGHVDQHQPEQAALLARGLAYESGWQIGRRAQALDLYFALLDGFAEHSERPCSMAMIRDGRALVRELCPPVDAPTPECKRISSLMVLLEQWYIENPPISPWPDD